MRRLIVTSTCFIAIASAVYAYVPPISELADRQSAWAMGVVFGSCMLAVVLGEVGRFLKIPRVLSYAAVGLLAAPIHGGAFRPHGLDVRPALEFFEEWTAVLGASLVMCGLAIGLKIDLKGLGASRRRLLAHATAHVLLVPPILFALWWTVGGSVPGTVVPVTLLSALVVATISSTSSATAIYTVNADLRAGTGFARGHLGFAVLKNAILAFGLLGGVALLQTEHVERDQLLHALTDLVLPLGIAFAVAVAAAALILSTLRWATNQVALVALSIAVICGVVFSTHPIALFAGAIVAGAVAASTSRNAFQLIDSFDRTNPFFVAVAFVFAFARIDLPTDLGAWQAALMFVGVRGAALYGASRLAGLALRDREARHFAYSTLAQSLTALFLTELAVEAAPELESTGRFLAAVVVMDLVIGTALHRLALTRSGIAVELGEAVGSFVVKTTDMGFTTATRPEMGDDASMLPIPEFKQPSFLSSKLNRVVGRLRQRLFRVQTAIVRDFFEPRRDFVDHLLDEVEERLIEHVLETYQGLRGIGDPEERRAFARERRSELDEDLADLILMYGPTHEPGDILAAIDDLVNTVERGCNIEAQVRAPEEDAARTPERHEPLVRRWRKRIHAFNTQFGPRPMRLVPIRSLALFHLVHGLGNSIDAVVHLDGRYRIYLWHRITTAYEYVDALYQATLERLDREGPKPRTQKEYEEFRAREDEELAAFDRLLLGPVEPELDGEDSEAADPMLGSESDAADDLILSAWATKLDQLPEDLDDIRGDAAAFDADVRRRLALTVADVYDALLRDAAIGGTVALPARQIDAAHRASLSRRHHVELDEEERHWLQLATAFVDRRLMLLAFRRLEEELRPTLAEFVERVETELSSRLTYYPAEISQRCEDVGRTLRETFGAHVSDADLSDAFEQIRHNLADFLQEEALTAVQEIRDADLFAVLSRDFAATLTELVERQRASFTAVDESFLDRPESSSARDMATHEIPFREILDKHLVQAVATSLNDLNLRVRRTAEAVASGLSDVNRVVSFNLDAAAAELRPAEGQETNRSLVAEFSVGGIERAGRTATALLERVSSEIDGIDEEIQAQTIEHVRAVRRFLFDEAMSRLERLAFEVESDRGQLQRQGLEAAQKLLSSAGEVAKRVAVPARSALDRAHERFSLREDGWAELLDDSGLASFELDRLEELPLAYRRLFTPTPVEIPELFVTRPNARRTFAGAVERWKAGRRVAIAITGPLGVGKTSFLHRTLTDELAGEKLVRWNVRERLTAEGRLVAQLSQLFGLPRVRTTDRLLAELSSLPQRRIVVVDGLERLFLRSIDGVAGLALFFDIVARSPQQLLWLVTANNSLWGYLETMHAADSYFTDRIALDRFGPEQLADLVLHRHAVSGYRAIYRSDTDQGDLRVAENQARAKKRFFRRMFDLTNGHPLLALYYWLSSVELASEEDDNVLFVNPIHRLRVDHLRHLDDHKLIGLSQVLLHEELTEEAFRAVMRESSADARRDLTYFESLNLVSRVPGRDLVYRINEVMGHDLRKALSERNLV